MNKTTNTGKKQSKKTKSVVSVTKAPLALGVAARASPPSVNGRDSFHVVRREFVGTATNGTTTGFALTTLSQALPGYDFNPSVQNLFPWVSNVANCYERFRFNKLSFHFVPSQAASTAGRFYAAVDYDYDDRVASTKTELMGNKTAVEAAVWQECRLVCDPASLNRDMPYRYISCTTRGLDVEGRTSFAGYLMCAFDTTATNCLIDIWVEYDLELVTPVNDNFSQELSSALDAYVTSTTAVTSGAGPYYGFPAPSKNTSFGTVHVVAAGTSTAPGMVLSGLNVPYALDIMDAKGKGFLDLLVSFNETGVPPVTNLTAAKALTIDWAIYNSLGTWLCSLTSSPTVVPATAFSHVMGPDKLTGDVNGAFIRSVTSVALDTLLSYVPSARFLVPLIGNAAAAIGAGSTAWGYRYKK